MLTVNEVANSIIDKLTNYAANLPDPTCIDYLNCEIEEVVRESRQKKKKKTTKKIADMTEEEFWNLPESSWSCAVKNSCQSVIKNMSAVNFSSAKVKL